MNRLKSIIDFLDNSWGDLPSNFQNAFFKLTVFTGGLVMLRLQRETEEKSKSKKKLILFSIINILISAVIFPIISLSGLCLCIVYPNFDIIYIIGEIVLVCVLMITY